VLDVALRMLFHDRAKFLITICAVAFAVTLVLVQVGLFRGLLGNATVTIERANADLWITSKNTPNIDFPHFFPESSVHRVRSVPGVERADNLLLAYVAMQLPTGAEETVVVYGLDDPKAWNLPWSVTEGSAESIRTGSRMLLDDSATRRFGRFQAGDYRELFGRRLEISGRTTEALSFTTMPIAFMSLRTGQGLQEGLFGGRASYILVKLAPGADPHAVATEIARRLPHNEVLTKTDWAARTRSYWVVSTGLGLNLALTVFLGILIGVTVVAQTLYAATLDHTREFGTLKAIGATSGHVCALVAVQAAIAGVGGYLLAIPCVLALRAGARQLGLDVILSPSLFGMVFIGSLGLCLGASLLTFRRIASIDPALVFRT